MATDQQAMEMATYPMDEWLRWEREHCDQDTILNHEAPIEDCPICRHGCNIAGCHCISDNAA